MGPLLRAPPQRKHCDVCEKRYQQSFMFARPGSRRDSYKRIDIPIVGDIRPILDEPVAEEEHAPSPILDIKKERDRDALSTAFQLRQQAHLDRAASVRVMNTSMVDYKRPPTRSAFVDSSDPYEMFCQCKKAFNIEQQPFSTAFHPNLFADDLKTDPFDHTVMKQVTEKKERRELFGAKLEPVESWAPVGSQRFPNEKTRQSLPFLTQQRMEILVPSDSRKTPESQADVIHVLRDALLRERSKSNLLLSRSAMKTPNTPVPSDEHQSGSLEARTNVTEDMLAHEMERVLIDSEEEEELFGDLPVPSEHDSFLPPDIQKSIELYLSKLPIWCNTIAPVVKQNERKPHVTVQRKTSSKGGPKRKGKQKMKYIPPPKLPSAEVLKQFQRQQRQELFANQGPISPDISRYFWNVFAIEVLFLVISISRLYNPSDMMWEFDPYTKSPLFWQNMIDLVSPSDLWKRQSSGRTWSSVTRSVSSSKKSKQKTVVKPDDNSLPAVHRNVPISNTASLHRSFHEPPGR